MSTKYANDIIAGITSIEAFDCCTCAVVFGLDSRFAKRRRADGRTWYCPNGHPQVFTTTDLQRAEQRIARLEAQNTHLRDQRQAAQRSANAYKGQVTKIRRRVGNGVCPCCNRTFADLARHMAGQHPDYAGASDA